MSADKKYFFTPPSASLTGRARVLGRAQTVLSAGTIFSAAVSLTSISPRGSDASSEG